MTDQPSGIVEPHIDIRRSARRRRTASARFEGDSIVVLVPAGLRADEEQRLASQLASRLVARQERQRRQRTDDELMKRAVRLASQHLDGPGEQVRPTSVRWVTNQNHRWGSCSPDTGAIRISDRLRTAPGYVLDHVMLHELAHLLEPAHNARFHRLADHPDRVRAEAFLHGWSVGAAHAAHPLPGTELAQAADGTIDVD